MKIIISSSNNSIITWLTECCKKTVKDKHELTIIISHSELSKSLELKDSDLAIIDEKYFHALESSLKTKLVPILLVADNITEKDNGSLVPVEIIKLFDSEKLCLEINNIRLLKKYIDKSRRIAETESIIAYCSEIFLKADPDNLDPSFNLALNKLLNFSKCNFGFVFRYSEDKKILQKLSSVSKSIEINLDNIELEKLPWVHERLKLVQDCFIPNIAALPLEATPTKLFFSSIGINAFCLVPILDEEYVIGCLMLGTEESKSNWPVEVATLIKRSANLVGMTFVRRRRRKTALARIEILEGILKANESRFINIMDSLSEGLRISDEDGLITYANKKFSELTGYENEEVVGKATSEIFFANSSNDHSKEIEQMHKRTQERMRGISETYELEITRKDGQMRWLEISAAPLRDSNGQIIGSIGMNTDITDKKQLEHQLRWSQKMEAVGRLAGGVAHDFNNLLTVISGYAEMLIKTSKPEEKNWRYINAIKEASKSATSLTQQLLTVSRKNIVQPTPSSLNEVFSEAIGILKGLVGEQIDLQIKFEPNLSDVMISPSQMEQVLMNLVINAKDAVVDGGTIKINSYAINCDSQVTFANLCLIPGKYVAFSVEDTGTGISDHVREHLFEPFFTTKRGGTGLGLSTVFGIVKQHKGMIATESELGVGSKFTVILPASAETRELAKPQIKDNAQTAGNERILLVEDEIGVRELIEELLKDKGYNVTTASNGGEALEILAKNALNFSLIITDVIMPKVSGFQLVEKVIAKDPSMKIIIMSGCTQDLSVPDSIRAKPLPFISKPFNTNEFLKKVRSILDSNEVTRPLLEAIND